MAMYSYEHFASKYPWIPINIDRCYNIFLN